MKAIKQALAVFILISGALIITGCPGTDSNSDGLGGGTYIIALEALIENGEIRSSHKSASEGETITITATPRPGHVTTSIRVRDAHYHPEDIVSDPEKENIFTFKMPASDVTVGATFDTVKVAFLNTFSELRISSTWKQINDANALLARVMENKGMLEDDDEDEIVRTNFDKLEKLVGDRIKAEDMTKWTSGELASYPMDKESEHPGYEGFITHLYFVKTKNKNTFPPVDSPAPGWKSSDPKPIDPHGFGDNPFMEIVYTYIIGTGTYDGEKTEIKHTLWLVPVAQYNVDLKTKLGSTFTLEAFYDGTENPAPGKPNVIDDSKTNWTGSVGKNLYTTIITDTANGQLYEVSDEDNKPVFSGGKQTSIQPDTFKPTSQVYKIVVTPAS